MTWESEFLSMLDLPTHAMSVAIDRVTSAGVPLATFVMVEKQGRRSLEQFPGGAQESAAAAGTYVQWQEDADQIALVTDSRINYRGQESAAIVVKSWAPNDGAPLLTAVRYEIHGLLRKKVTIIDGILEFVSGGWAEYLAREAPVHTPALGSRVLQTALGDLAGSSGPLLPFAVVEKGGERTLVRMTGERFEQLAEAVRQYAFSRTDADFIAFAVDGFAQADGLAVDGVVQAGGFAVDGFTQAGGERSDAVIVEIWEYATRLCFTVAQRYRPQSEPTGGVVVVGAPLLRTADGWQPAPPELVLGGVVVFGDRG